MNIDLEKIIKDTKKITLGAIRKYLNEDNYEYIDDVTQEVYFRVYKALKKGQFENRAKLSTWIYVIAKNESFRLNAKLQKQRNLEQKMIEEYKTNQRKLEVEHSSDDNSSSWLESITKLPEKYQELIQCYISGFSEKEMATRFSLKLGTVKSRIHRAKQILKSGVQK